ncbi:MAG TPA: TldD/PmbA family protein, partial [Myxococcaceae bacterium]|nr:TldD/PmbA family protein [Myxococcaceae bacterium]
MRILTSALVLLVSSAALAASPAKSPPQAPPQADAQETKLTAPADPRLKILDAMAAELERNQTQLKVNSHEPPYFVSYQVKDYETIDLDARYGALFNDARHRDRKIYADVRVGSYDFDNSMEEGYDYSFSTKGQSFIPRKDAPLDDDPVALRTALWLISDEKYKTALYNYLKKKGENVYTVEDPKRAPSFSREKPSVFVQPPLSLSFERDRWVKLARELSARFKEHPQFFDSDVHITAEKVTRYFVSSEGSRIVTEDLMYGFHIQAVTRADDGQLL